MNHIHGLVLIAFGTKDALTASRTMGIGHTKITHYTLHIYASDSVTRATDDWDLLILEMNICWKDPKAGGNESWDAAMD